MTGGNPLQAGVQSPHQYRQPQYQHPPPEYRQQPQYVGQPFQNPGIRQTSVAPQTSTSTGTLTYSVMAGFFPIPFNPLFFPIQMTAFIILVIILLIYGWGFMTSIILAWVIPAVFAVGANYMMFSSMFG